MSEPTVRQIRFRAEFGTRAVACAAARTFAFALLAIGCGGSAPAGGGNSGQAPQITTAPQSVSVSVGATATFSVVATGSAPIAFQWSRNATQIPGATGSSYTTPATALADSGASFDVVASNATGTVTSAPATLTVTATTASGVDVITYHNDVSRTGANLAERKLAPSNVTQATFGLQHLLPVDGKVDAQPLVLAGLTIAGQVHTVVYVATEHDSVYAFDVDTGTKLWQVSLLVAGETPSDARSCDEVVPEIGVTATPVIDRSTGTLYVVAMSVDANRQYHQRLHAISVTTGAELPASPVAIVASVVATGSPFSQGGRVVFEPGQYKERAALLLASGTVYVSWGAHCDVPNYTGWIMAYSASTLQQLAVFNDEPSGVQAGGQGEAGFWNSGSGPSVDSAGNVYAMSGNGILDATFTASGFPVGNDYGNVILKLSPPAGGTLRVLDFFTMFDAATENAADMDLGSGGLMLLPDQVVTGGATRHLAIGAGKDQNIYVVDRDNLGKFNPLNNSNAYQFLPGVFNSGSAVGCGTLPGYSGVYGAPVYLNGTVYYAAAGDSIRSFAILDGRLPPSANTHTSKLFCFPGATLAISANGSANGILWAVENSQTQGVLHAYDAANLSVELYNSAQAGARDRFGAGSKFTPPTIANGKVFVGTQVNLSTNPSGQNSVAVFGAL